MIRAQGLFFNGRQPTACYWQFQKSRGVLERFNITVGCEIAAPTQLLHCFLECAQSRLEFLEFLSKELDFSKGVEMEQI